MSIKNNIFNDSIKFTEEPETNAEVPIFDSWDSLNLDPNLLRGIYAYGFEKPSVIQSKAIHPIMLGKDIIA